MQELRDRQLQDRHEAIIRDDAILRRINMHDERMEVHAETLKKMIAAVGECADTITRVGQRIDALVVRMGETEGRSEQLIVRMDKTDERWNQFDQLAREHRNGGKKR